MELAAIYLLERRPGEEGPAAIFPESPRRALVRLLEHGVAAGPAEALGLARQRFERLAELVERVAVARLELPSGSGAAGRAHAAIAADLRATR